MPQRTTTLGTPTAPAWTAEWLARVEAEETALGRRICGAMTLSMGPCKLASDHPSGRCRYHGGVPTVGPPSENQNARIHGLYARRLQRCGPQCPLWNSCAYAGKDVEELDPKDRPICAYERDEYAALIKHYFKEDLEPPEDASGAIEDETENNDEDPRIAALLRRAALNKRSEPECPEPFLLHQLVLLTIMQTRAAAVLSGVTLTDAVEVDSPGYKMKTAKPGAVLEAFLRIAREYRALRAVIDTKKLIPKPQSMGIGSRLAPLMLKTKEILKECIEDLDAPEKSDEVRELGSEEARGEGVARSELASSEAVNGEVANGEIQCSEMAEGPVRSSAFTRSCVSDSEPDLGIEIDGGVTAGAGVETATGPPKGDSGPIAASGPLNNNKEETPEKREANRPPPLLWSDVEARRLRSRSPIHDFLFGDRGG